MEKIEVESTTLGILLGMYLEYWDNDGIYPLVIRRGNGNPLHWEFIVGNIIHIQFFFSQQAMFN